MSITKHGRISMVVNQSKTIKDLLKDPEVQSLIDWNIHPFEAVARYMEWGNNWSRGLDHAKSCNEEAMYFKINSLASPPKLLLVKHSHHLYSIIAEVEAPEDLIRKSIELDACKNASCGICDELRDWLRSQ